MVISRGGDRREGAVHAVRRAAAEGALRAQSLPGLIDRQANLPMGQQRTGPGFWLNCLCLSTTENEKEKKRGQNGGTLLERRNAVSSWKQVQLPKQYLYSSHTLPYFVLKVTMSLSTTVQS